MTISPINGLVLSSFCIQSFNVTFFICNIIIPCARGTGIIFKCNLKCSWGLELEAQQLRVSAALAENQGLVSNMCIRTA